MGSVLSSAYAALCSFVKAQLDKAEERRLMAIVPGLRDLPAEERERALRWLMEEDEDEDEDDDGDRPHPVADHDRWQDPHKVICKCNYRDPRYRVRDKTASK